MTDAVPEIRNIPVPAITVLNPRTRNKRVFQELVRHRPDRQSEAVGERDASRLTLSQLGKRRSPERKGRSAWRRRREVNSIASAKPAFLKPSCDNCEGDCEVGDRSDMSEQN
jgi:hypothetical protein